MHGLQQERRGEECTATASPVPVEGASALTLAQQANLAIEELHKRHLLPARPPTKKGRKKKKARAAAAWPQSVPVASSAGMAVPTVPPAIPFNPYMGSPAFFQQHAAGTPGVAPADAAAGMGRATQQAAALPAPAQPQTTQPMMMMMPVPPQMQMQFMQQYMSMNPQASAAVPYPAMPVMAPPAGTGAADSGEKQGSR